MEQKNIIKITEGIKEILKVAQSIIYFFTLSKFPIKSEDNV